MDALRKGAFYTIDDIYALPDGERAELIDGQIYYMAPPSRTHQGLSMFLSSAILAHIREKGGGCEVYAVTVFLWESTTQYSLTPAVRYLNSLVK